MPVSHRCIKRSLFISAAFFFLAACGGGGGGGGGDGGSVTANNPSTQIAQGYADLIQNGYHVSLQVTGTAAGHPVSGTATQTSSPTFAAMFEGQNALANTVTVAGSITVGGNVIPLSGHVTTYSTSNYLPLGEIDNDDGSYTVVTSSSPLPTTGYVGDTGTLLQSTTYQDQTKAVIVNTAVKTYVIEEHNSTSVIFHTIEKIYEPNNALRDTSHERYLVTTAGAISFYSSSYQTADGSASFDFTPQ